MAHQKFIFYKNEDGQYEVYFGDGVIGKKLDDGNIVSISYVVTNKTVQQCYFIFIIISISVFNDVTVTVNSSAQGNADPENLESIKFNAPNFYSSQDRTSYDRRL